jgi:hypothetical protein
MVIITFPDRDTQREALGFLMRRFSGTVFKTGEHIVPEAALKALEGQNLVFTVRGTVNAKQVAALRNSATTRAQRRSSRSKGVADQDLADDRS